MILSVPHSGTRFLKDRLGDPDHAHTHWGWDRISTALAACDCPPIVPLRSPADVWNSWCRRNPDNFPYCEFFLAWGQLHALDMMMELDVICIDRQDDPRIDDWTPTGVYDAGQGILPIDLRSLHNLPIVERYFGPHAMSGLPLNQYVQEDRIKLYG